MEQFFLCTDEQHFYELSTLIREFFPLCKVVPDRCDQCPGISLYDGNDPSAVGGTLYDSDGQEILSLTVSDAFENFQ